LAAPNRRVRRFIPRPTVDEMKELAAAEYMHFSEEEASRYVRVFGGLLDIVERLEEIPLPGPVGPLRTRDVGYVPSVEEDPFNVFTRRCLVQGDADGPLSGMTFAVKDNIAVAGIPTTNGSRNLAYVPRENAAVVERLLAAGATLIGKLNMDDFASGPTGETSYFGPARNPVNPDYSAGGSSGGAGAVVAAGLVDFSLGVDQGGSARIPASFCGVTTVKATHGLVPSRGSAHLDHTIDYICPTARSVAVVAQVLEVIAGPDDKDPQWVRGEIQLQPYGAATPAVPSDLTVGILKQARVDACDPDVLANFDRSVDYLRSEGARVAELDVPLWPSGWEIENVLLIHLVGSMMKSEGAGYSHLGTIDPDAIHAFALSRRLEADFFPPLIKVWLVGERFLHQRLFNRTYAMAQNLRLMLRGQLSDALQQCDVILTPGTATTAPKLFTEPVEDETTLMSRVDSAVYFTCPVNLSGHPALVLPNGVSRLGLPTSVQVVGRHFDEQRIFSVGLTLEKSAQ
jgi:amidase